MVTQVQAVKNTHDAGGTLSTTITSATSGNLLLSTLVIERDNAMTVTPPSGWTSLIDDYDAYADSPPGQSNIRIFVYYKEAAGGETSVAWTSSINADKVVWVHELSGWDNTLIPKHDEVLVASGTPTSLSAFSVDHNAAAGNWGLAILGVADSVATSPAFSDGDFGTVDSTTTGGAFAFLAAVCTATTLEDPQAGNWSWTNDGGQAVGALVVVEETAAAATPTKKVRISGTWVDKPVKVRIGGTWV